MVAAGDERRLRDWQGRGDYVKIVIFISMIFSRSGVYTLRMQNYGMYVDVRDVRPSLSFSMRYKLCNCVAITM